MNSPAPAPPSSLPSSSRPRSGAWWWLCLFLFLVVLRYVLPQTRSDVMTVHMAAAEAMASGLGWGRQALVGSLQYPPMVMVGSLTAWLVEAGTQVDGARLLVAVAQSWALVYLLRTPQTAVGRLLVPILGAPLLLVPACSAALAAQDPNWISVVPIAAAVYHTSRWCSARKLRDLTVTAVNCGLLVFAGIPGAFCAAGILTAFTADVLGNREEDRRRKQGELVLLWSPAIYTTSVLLLLNWLVMGDGLFPFREMHQAGFGWGHVGTGLQRVQSWILPALAAVGLLSLMRGTFPWRCLLGALLGLLAGSILCEAFRIFPVGARPMSAYLGLGALLLAVVSSSRKAARLGAGLLLGVTALALIRAPGPASPWDTMLRSAPPRAYLETWIDRRWDRSRIVICGLPGAAAYLDVREERFVAALDFHRQGFLDRARDELVHVLVPPDNALFYAPRRSAMARLHQNGADPLLLELQWDNGWQLWRSVVAPEGESRLDGPKRGSSPPQAPAGGAASP